MDVQDHKKTSPPGCHESQGVHFCHKCGWPFPNPHPSAKHRRAHKRVCGNIEGYKLLKSDSDPSHLSVSDDEHHSDDDCRTPSPKIDKENVKELGSSEGNVLRSYRSSEEVFSDAVTEFSDNGVSPGMYERIGSGKNPDADVKGVLVIDLIKSDIFKGDDTSGETEASDGLFPTQPPKGLVTQPIMLDPEVVGTETNLSRSTDPAGETEILGVSNDNMGQNGLSFSSTQDTDKHILHSETIEHQKVKELSSVQVTNNHVVHFETDDHEKEKELVSTPVMGEHVIHSETDEHEKEKELIFAPVMAENVIHSETDVHEKEKELISAPVMDEYDVHSETDEHEKEELISSVQANVANKVNSGADSQYIESKFEETEDRSSEPEALQLVVPEIGTEISDPLTILESNLVDDKALTAGALDENVEVKDVVISTQTGSLSSSSGFDPAKVEADSTIGSTSTKPGLLAEIRNSKEEGNIDTRLSLAETLPALEKPEVVAGDFKDYKVFKSSIVLDLGDTEVIVSKDDKNEATDPEEYQSILSSDVGTLNKSFSNLDDNGDGIQNAVLSPVEGEVAETCQETSGYDHDNQTKNNYKDSQPYSANEKPVNLDDSELVTGEHLEVIQMPSVDEETSRNAKLNGGANADANLVAKTLLDGAENEKMEAGDECLAKVAAKTAYSENSAETGEDKCNNNLAGDQFDALEKSMVVQKETAELDATADPVDCSDTNRESVQQLPNSSESGKVIDSDQANIDSRGLENVADLSTSSKRFDEDKYVKDLNVNNTIVSVPLLDEGDARMAKQQPSAAAVNVSITSSSRSDSLEGNWGSVSVLSNQSDVAAIAESEVLASTDSKSAEKLDGNLLKLPQVSAEGSKLDKADDFEPPSFATLVESSAQDNNKAPASEIRMEQKVEKQQSEALQAGWFPSLTNVVNESQGRKKNEEIIAKVTNWSTGKPHGPLKNFLNEAHEEAFSKPPQHDPKQASANDQTDETALKSDDGAVTTVSSIMGSEIPGKKEMEKEWDSPARYPTAIKKEKRKGKPYWVPFVCCSSMHHDI